MRSKIASFVEKISYKGICILSFIVVLYLFVQDLCMRVRINSAETVSFGRQKWWGYLIGLAVVIALFMARKYFKVLFTHRKIVGFTIVYAVLMVLFVVTVQMEPRADQQVVLQVVDQMAKGDFSAWQKGAYCDMYPNQYGLITVLAVLSKVLGKYNWLAYQCLNILFILLAAWGMKKSLYLIFKNEKFAVLSYVVLLCYLPLAGYVTFVYGTLPGLACVTVGSYFLMLGWQESKLVNCAVGAVLLVVAVLLKNNYLITLITMAIAGALVWLKQRGKTILISLVMIVFVYILANAGVNLYISGKTEIREQGGIPAVAWVAMGLQDEGTKAPGWYTSYAKHVYWSHNSDKELAGEAAKQTIKDLFSKMKSDPVYCFSFFNRKTASQWNEATFESVQINQFRTDRKRIPSWLSTLFVDDTLLNRRYAYACDVLLFLIWTGLLMFLVKMWKEQDIRKVIWLIMFFGGFLFHLFWEAKGQYTVIYVWFCIPYAIWGYLHVLDSIHKYTKRRFQNGEKE